MTNEISVYLTDKPASSPWGQHSLISLSDNRINIHVPKNHKWPLREIQKAGRQCCNLGLPALILAGKNWDIDSQWAFYQGLSNVKKPSQLRFAKLDADQEKLLQSWLKVYSWAKAQINAPAQEKSPKILAENAIAFLEEIAPGKISSSLIIGEDLKKQGLMGLYSVGKGSDHPPVMAVIDYNPKKNKTAPTAAALVGKGICFDSGGYSLKQTEAMSTMKNDMGGAASVCAALALAILQGFKKRTQIILCCAENLVSGHAYKLGDIIHYKNGISVEVVNTDAEGRLVLADGLIKASETEAPLIIDAATLTGAAVIAVGTDYTALFSLDADLRNRALHYAQSQNELVWPMPLETWHRDQVPSYYADTANSRKVPMGGPGGASNAAGFLSRFVPNDGKGWLHFDLANAFQNDATALFGAGATGASIKTIAETLLKETK